MICNITVGAGKVKWNKVGRNSILPRGQRFSSFWSQVLKKLWLAKCVSLDLWTITNTLQEGTWEIFSKILPDVSWMIPTDAWYVLSTKKEKIWISKRATIHFLTKIKIENEKKWHSPAMMFLPFINSNSADLWRTSTKDFWISSRLKVKRQSQQNPFENWSYKLVYFCFTKWMCSMRRSWVLGCTADCCTVGTYRCYTSNSTPHIGYLGMYTL